MIVADLMERVEGVGVSVSEVVMTGGPADVTFYRGEWRTGMRVDGPGRFYPIETPEDEAAEIVVVGEPVQFGVRIHGQGLTWFPVEVYD